MVAGETVRETNRAPTTHKPGCTRVCLLVKLLENYRQWHTCEILNEAYGRDSFGERCLSI